MRNRIRLPILCLVINGLIVTGQVALAQNKTQESTAPQALNLSKVKIEIVNALFVKELDGVNATYKESQPDKYRGLVLTLRIKKPAGEELKVNAQDMVLHYKHGSDSDVCKSTGLSFFSVDENAERPMNLLRLGYGTSKTGNAATKASIVYIDLFFQNMEPDTTELHLLVAQPIGVSFKADGWK